MQLDIQQQGNNSFTVMYHVSSLLNMHVAKFGNMYNQSHGRNTKFNVLF